MNAPWETLRTYAVLFEDGTTLDVEATTEREARRIAVDRQRKAVSASAVVRKMAAQDLWTEDVIRYHSAVRSVSCS